MSWVYLRTTVDELLARVMVYLKSKTCFALTTGNSHKLENILSQSCGIGFDIRVKGRQQNLDKIILACSAFVYS